jgi:hypothetical protein
MAPEPVAGPACTKEVLGLQPWNIDLEGSHTPLRRVVCLGDMKAARRP